MSERGRTGVRGLWRMGSEGPAEPFVHSILHESPMESFVQFLVHESPRSCYED